MSAQKRSAPAFQEYASDMIARFEYRTLTLPQRGLLYSMRLECWVNQFLPESPAVLARILGFDHAEVAAELPYVMPFFACENGRITSPELEAYRAHIEDIRERKSSGGKRGAAKTNAGRKPKPCKGSTGIPTGNVQAMPSGISPAVPRVSQRVLSRVEPEPSQGGNVFNPSVYLGEWDDFTRDLEQEGGQ